SGGRRVRAVDTVTVRISSGPLIAKITGGSAVMVSSQYTLDASVSVDSDRAGLSHLSFQWSCVVATLTSFGTSCTKDIL
ncbi:hypothetical protein ELP91_28995, partial [Klebsiella pneumoniae]|nr:hypothetical protein [Klebsiella pneumoniae]